MVLGLVAFSEHEALQAWGEADESRVQGRVKELRTKRRAAEIDAVVKGRDASVDSGLVLCAEMTPNKTILQERERESLFEGAVWGSRK